MRHVEFRRLFIQNFLSVGNEPLVIDFTPGIHFITGYNYDADSRNGVGKSTIADALFFALFGSALRNVGNSCIPNRYVDGRPRLELSFAVHHSDRIDSYELIRLLKPSRLLLTKNGQDETQTINESTHRIYDIISASPEVLANCSVMTVNNATPFLGQKKIDKRKFIEGILGIDIFSKMLLEVRRQANDKSREFEQTDRTAAQHYTHLTQLETQQALHRQQFDRNIAKLKERLEVNCERIAEINRDAASNLPDIDIVKSKAQIELLHKQITKDETAIQSNMQKCGQITGQIANLRRERTKYTTTSKECPECRRPYDDANSHQHDKKVEALTVELAVVEDKSDKLNITIHNLRTHLAECKRAITKLQKRIEGHHTLLATKATAATTISQLQQQNLQIEQDITTANTDDEHFTPLIANTKQLYDEVMKVVSQLKTELEVLETARFVVSEEGVKSFIVRRMLALFNSRLSHYLERLGANCTCTIDEYFEEQIVDDQGNETSYHNYSAGEAKRIDLALLLTFQDVRRLQTDAKLNLSIYDELLDSALDKNGVVAVLDILRERVANNNECIYIITHRSECLQMAEDATTIHLEKRNGCTKIDQSFGSDP